MWGQKKKRKGAESEKLQNQKEWLHQVLYIHYIHVSLTSFCSHFKGKLRLRESNLDYFPRVAQLVHSRAGTWTKFFQHKAYDWRCTVWPRRTSLIPLLPWEVSGLSLQPRPRMDSPYKVPSGLGPQHCHAVESGSAWLWRRSVLYIKLKSVSHQFPPVFFPGDDHICNKHEASCQSPHP